MNHLNTPYADYQDNLISEDFLLENGKAWKFGIGTAPGNTVGLVTTKSFVGTTSLRIFNANYQTVDITVEPNVVGEYVITVPKTGYYNFCLRTLIKTTAPSLPELAGTLLIYKNGNTTPDISSVFNIGNNTEPEFTYQYNKWQLFYDKFPFVAGDTFTIKISIASEPSFLANQFELFIDGFQFNFMDEVVNTIPSLYVKPIF